LAPIAAGILLNVLRDLLTRRGVGLESVKWFIKSAKSGYILSQFYLGLAYISGEDININKREGMKRMKRAAKNGDSKAIEYLESHHE